MAKPLFSNNAGSALASAITSGATTLTVTAGQGGLFPTPSGGDTFTVTLYAVTGVVESAWEVMTCTARSGDVLTVTRGQEGTTAQAWPLGTPVEARLTAGVMTALHAPKTASRALVTDASGYAAPSVVTTTELNCLSGVTSALQTQLAAKASLSGATFTGGVTVPSLNGGPLAGMRNLLINGDFRIWQRGGSGFTTFGYTADRARFNPNGSTATVSRHLGIGPVGGAYQYMYKVSMTSQAASEVPFYEQLIEDVYPTAGRTITVGGWLYSAVAYNGTSQYVRIIATQYFGSGGSTSVATVLLNGTGLSIGWNYISATATLPSTTAKTIGSGNALVIGVYGIMPNGYDLVFHEWQCELGSVATPFEKRPVALELLLCQRYFTIVSGVFRNDFAYSDYYFKASMRGLPTISNIVAGVGSGGTLTVVSPERCHQGTLHSAISNFTAWADAEI